jgi:hypothetical protein
MDDIRKGIMITRYGCLNCEEVFDTTVSWEDIMCPKCNSTDIISSVDFKHTFSGLHGERVYKYLNNITHQKKMSYIRNESDVTSFNEGKRFVGLDIIDWFEMV